MGTTMFLRPKFRRYLNLILAENVPILQDPGKETFLDEAQSNRLGPRYQPVSRSRCCSFEMQICLESWSRLIVDSTSWACDVPCTHPLARFRQVKQGYIFDCEWIAGPRRRLRQRVRTVRQMLQVACRAISGDCQKEPMMRKIFF